MSPVFDREITLRPESWFLDCGILYLPPPDAAKFSGCIERRTGDLFFALLRLLLLEIFTGRGKAMADLDSSLVHSRGSRSCDHLGGIVNSGTVAGI